MIMITSVDIAQQSLLDVGVVSFCTLVRDILI